MKNIMSRLANSKIGRVAGSTLAGMAPVVVPAIPIAWNLINPPAVYAKELGLLQEPKTGLCERMYPKEKVNRELESETTTVSEIDFFRDGRIDGLIDYTRTTTEETYNVTGPYCAFCGMPVGEIFGGSSKAEGEFLDGVDYVEYVDIDNDGLPNNVVTVTFEDGTITVKEDWGADGDVDYCYRDNERVNCEDLK